MNFIRHYFEGEQSESIIFMLAGMLAMAASIYFVLKIKKRFYIGVSYICVAVALMHIIIGSIIYIRTPKDIQRVEAYFTEDRQKIQTEEIPRMEKVMDNFVLYRWIEIGMTLLGLVLLFLKHRPLLKGIGVGLIMEGVLSLTLDFFAEQRGDEYLRQLLDGLI